jgi:4-oxalocrotonate tautomerase
VQVFLRRGRTVEAKQAFYQRAVELLGERAGVRGEDVTILLSENGAEDWSFGNGSLSM